MRIIVADDHPLYLSAVRDQLLKTFQPAEVSTVASLGEVFALLGGAPVDLVMVDYAMPGMDGVDTFQRLVAAVEPAPVVVMSGIATMQEIRCLIEAGAKGFLAKTLDAKLFTAALAVVTSGGTYVAADFFMARPPSTIAATRGPHDFSKREITMLRLMTKGATNKDIGRELRLQETTIKFYMSNLFRKLNVKNRAQATAVVLQMNLVEEPPGNSTAGQM